MYILAIVNGKEKVLCQATFDKLLNLEVPIMIVDSFYQKWQAERELKRVRVARKRDRDWQKWLDEDEETDVASERMFDIARH